MVAAALTTALALSAVLGLVPSPAGAATAKERRVAKHTKVYVQGDSLTVGSGPGITRRLTPSVRRVAVDAQVSRPTSVGVARTLSSAAARASRVWVIALGTNDAPSPSYIRAQIKRTLNAGDRQVIWVTIVRPGGYAKVNRMMRQQARKRPRLHVVDWARAVQQNRSLIGGDGVHATSYGYEVRAALIAAEARSLAQRG